MTSTPATRELRRLGPHNSCPPSCQTCGSCDFRNRITIAGLREKLVHLRNHVSLLIESNKETYKYMEDAFDENEKTTKLARAQGELIKNQERDIEYLREKLKSLEERHQKEAEDADTESEGEQLKWRGDSEELRAAASAFKTPPRRIVPTLVSEGPGVPHKNFRPICPAPAEIEAALDRVAPIVMPVPLRQPQGLRIRLFRKAEVKIERPEVASELSTSPKKRKLEWVCTESNKI